MPRRVRVTDGAWTAYKIPTPAETDIKPVKNNKNNKTNKSNRRQQYKSPSPVGIYKDPPESISEFSDDSLPRLFGADSRLSTPEEEEEEEPEDGEIEPVKNVLPKEFYEARREETPFFGKIGGGERGFDVWRDQY